MPFLDRTWGPPRKVEKGPGQRASGEERRPAPAAELYAPDPPSDLVGARELRLLSVLLDCCASTTDGEGRFETEQLRLAAKEAGHLSATARLVPTAPAPILELLGRGDEGLDGLLHMAQCTQREAEILILHSHGLTTLEIQDALRHQRGARRLAPAIHTIENQLLPPRHDPFGPRPLPGSYFKQAARRLPWLERGGR